jgi:hypothetical protein
MNQAKRTAALIAAAFLAGCAGGGGSGGGSSTGGGTPYRPPPVDTPCGLPVCTPYLPSFPGDPGYVDPYAPVDLYELLGIPRPTQPPLGPIFRSWAELPPLVSAQFDAVTGRVSYQARFFTDYTGNTGSQIKGTDSFCCHGNTAMALGGPTYDAKGELNFLPRLFSESGTWFQRDSTNMSTLAPIGQPGIDVVLETWLPSAFSANVVVANPHALGWNYQSFGVWDDHDFGTSTLYLKSFGAATPAAAVPTTGSATFSGKLAGLYVSPNGEGSIATAELKVDANFATRSLSFASTGTTTTRDRQTATAAPNLNLSGTLTYSPGQTAISGTLTNAGGTMSGSTNARYYGPAAQELGGVFALKSPKTVETFAGAYGAKR